MILANRLFNDVFTNWDKVFFAGDYPCWHKNHNARSKEFEDSYEYYVPLPGVKKEDIKVTLNDGEVHLTTKKDEGTANYSFLIPEDVNLIKQPSARHEDGLLTIKLNKKERTKALEIKIK
tara:strand:- start:381 stop:740 length:360 start_codon:yes stop_codon:yes gene_type:complete